MLRAYLIDLGIIPYGPAIRLQEWIFKACQEKNLPPVVILQENLPVFTIGRAGSWANILSTPVELDQRGIDVIQVNRGGDVTYHGPGQLIGSPLVYLGDLELNANQYMHKLEDVIIGLLKPFGILAHKDPDYPGAWVNTAKIGAVGLVVKNGYTMHGFSINVDLDLFPYQLINPCGVPQMPVTCMARQLDRAVTVAEVKEHLAEVFHQVLGLELETAGWDLLRTLKPRPYLLEILEKTKWSTNSSSHLLPMDL
jgi:lipoyl(octanoyl) transferase